MKFTWLWWARCQAATFMASCSDLTGLSAKNSFVRCDSISNDRGSGEGSLAIVEISEKGVYLATAVVVAAVVAAMVVVAAVVVAAVVVAAVVVTAVVVTAAGVESRLITVVAVVKDPLKSMASLSTATMSLIDVNSIVVIRYGWDGDNRRSHQRAEGDEPYRQR